MTPENQSVAVVVVTYNRADLLERMLAGLAALTRAPDAVYVVDNASTDHTAKVLDRVGSTLPTLRVVRSVSNLGGAGGFHLGVRTAYAAGHDWIWLMDDDVVPEPDCLTVLLTHGDGADSPGGLMAVREDLSGRLVEKAALRFDLRNPLRLRPKTAMVETTYGTRAAMPDTVRLENVAFEGFLVHRRVVEAIGLPDPSFFIFYDDVDFAIRARRAGFPIEAVRDARLVRQLDFDQQHDLSGWKGFYMFRNLFVVHLRYGENPAVRAKPWLIAAGVAATSLARHPGATGRRTAGNALRALRSARGMRHVPAEAGPEAAAASLQ